MPDALSAYIFYIGFLVILGLAVRQWYEKLVGPEPEEPPVDRYWKDSYDLMKSYYASEQLQPPVADRRYLNPLGPQAGGWRAGNR